MTRSVVGVRASTRARQPTKELFVIIPMYAHDEEGINPGQVSSTNCDRYWCLD